MAFGRYPLEGCLDDQSEAFLALAWVLARTGMLPPSPAAARVALSQLEATNQLIRMVYQALGGR